jgi:phospholipid-translocating ATPase
MCKEVGFAYFIERDSNVVKIFINGEVEIYTVLKVVEFTSERKRMSVVVRRESDQRIINFIKGADLAILPRLAPDSDKEINKKTVEIMD